MKKIFKNGFLNMLDNIKNKNIKQEIPNILTLSRLLAPFILIPLIILNKKISFIIMIIIFSITDFLDGYYARKYKINSLFGKYLDAFVDKIYVGTLLFPVIILINKNLIIFIWLIIILELIISIINIYYFYHKCNPRSTYLGKFKTIILFLTIGLIYLNSFGYNLINLKYFIYITIIFQIIAIISYFMQKKTEFNSVF